MTADLHFRGAACATIVMLGALLGGCATSPPASPVVARSRLGVVSAADLDRFISDDPRWRDGAPEQRNPSWRRARLEELLALTALADEARRDGLLESGPAAREWQRRRRSMLVEEVERRTLAIAPRVGDADVEAYLADHPEELRRDEQLRLRHIFRHLPARSTETERARAREEMEALLEELRRGADFSQLARERSDSQSAGFDGLIAPVAVGDLAPEVEDVVWRLDVSEVSAVVETPVGLHVFRLEERLSATGIPAEQARARVRGRLEREDRQAAADRAFTDLLQSSGAAFRPQLLSLRDGDPAAAVLEVGSQRLTVRDIREQWSALPFQTRRTTSLEQVLRDEAWQRLAMWEAERLDLESDPAVAVRLRHAEEAALVSAALARWVDHVRGRVSDRELAEHVAAHESDFRRSAAWRLRIVLRHQEPGRPALEAYDQLDQLAVAVRSGELELDEAARLWSTDPSGDAGGDLGWVDAKSLAAWAGGRFSQGVLGLAVGELSDPLLVEVYEPERLKYRADSYALVRVEERRPEGMPPLEEIREQALDGFLAERAPEIRRELRRRILEHIGTIVDEQALAATAQPDS